ncbi:hypothetical protein FACS189476_05610 [Spirochaetia bacterium]|nr:hypothetical protein FACS189476_05610 [Spirochaetia bacterium]
MIVDANGNMINSNSVLIVNYLSSVEEQAILNYFQGAVYCWCNINKYIWFRDSSFVGGINVDWTGTPLFILFDHYKSLGESNQDAYDHAAPDSGTLLKLFLHRDSRTYEIRKTASYNEYKFVKL